MPYTYTIHEEEDFLNVIVTGSTESAVETARFATQLGTEAQKRARTHILLDETGFEPLLDQFDIYNFSEKLSVQFPALGLKIAVLHREERRKFYTCAETFLRNRSINYRVFQDRTEALKWLRA